MDRRFWRAAAVSAVLAAGTWLSAGEEFLLGSCAHFSKSRADVNATLDLMVEGGLSATRDDIVWAGWERERGKYTPQGYYESYLNRALELGLRPMQLINYGHKLYDPSGAMLYENPNPPQEAFDAFGRFAGWVAARYRGRGNAPQIYQIWNEWPGQAAPYAKALAAAYAQMKKADPDCIIVANSCHRREPFLEETFQQGVLQNCDGIAWHNYNHGELGEKNRSSETFFARVCNALELSKKYNNGFTTFRTAAMILIIRRTISDSAPPTKLRKRRSTPYAPSPTWFVTLSLCGVGRRRTMCGFCSSACRTGAMSWLRGPRFPMCGIS